jgi:hypothetical protein
MKDENALIIKVGKRLKKKIILKGKKDNTQTKMTLKRESVKDGRKRTERKKREKLVTDLCQKCFFKYNKERG